MPNPLTLALFLALMLVPSLSLAVPPPDPSRSEKDIAAFEAADRRSAPPKGAILFVGSSSIRLWTNVAASFPEWQVISRGFGGAHLSEVNAFFDRLITVYQPAKIILYAGENDIAAGRSPEETFAEFKEFVATLRQKVPGAKLYYLSAKPSPSRWFLWPQISDLNNEIRKFARRGSNITFVDVGTPLLGKNGQPDESLFVKDRLHINERGYQLWAEQIRRAARD